MQIKTTMKYRLTPVRMAIIKKTTNNPFGKDVEKRELLYTAGGNVNWPRNLPINICWIELRHRFWEIRKGRWAEELVN